MRTVRSCRIQKLEMASEELKTRVIHICSDVEDFYDSYDIELMDDEHDLQDYISRISDLKRHFRRIYSELKVAEGPNFANNFPNFEKDLNGLTDLFKAASKKLSDLRKGDKQNEISKQNNFEQQLSDQAKLEEEKRRNDIMSCAKSLFVEIEVRYKSLKKKFDKKIEELDAYEILDLKKREDNFHTELRELIDKISSFEKFVLPCG